MFNKLKTAALSAFALLAGLVGSAHAALPTAVTDPTTGAFATITADFLELLDLIWPLAVTFTVAFIILRMFKRGASVATS